MRNVMLSRRSFQSLAMSAWNKAATHTATSTRVQTSQMRNSSVGYRQLGRTSHQSFVPSGMHRVLHRVSTRYDRSAQDANTGGMPDRGNARKMMLRYDRNPVFRPSQNGELAARQSTWGMK